MKNLTKVLAVAVVATMTFSSISVFAAESETTTDYKRPAFAMNMKSKGEKFKLRKMPELTEEQKSAIAEKIESGEGELGKKCFGKKVFNGEKPELTEEQKAVMAEKIASGEFKPMTKVGKGMKTFAKKAPKLNANKLEVAE